MARKYKLLSQSEGNLTKLQQEAKYKAEFLAKDGFKALPLEAPEFLPPYGKQEYERLAPQMQKLPIRDLDLTSVLLYCTWYAAYRETLDYLKDIPNIDKTSRLEGYLSLNKITTNIKALSSDLGLTVNSRMQMNVEALTEKKGPKSMKERYG